MGRYAPKRRRRHSLRMPRLSLADERSDVRPLVTLRDRREAGDVTGHR